MLLKVAVWSTSPLLRQAGIGKNATDEQEGQQEKNQTALKPR